jgi:hypothetical protein
VSDPLVLEALEDFEIHSAWPEHLPRGGGLHQQDRLTLEALTDLQVVATRLKALNPDG